MLELKVPKEDEGRRMWADMWKGGGADLVPPAIQSASQAGKQSIKVHLHFYRHLNYFPFSHTRKFKGYRRGGIRNPLPGGAL